ncbi:MAG: endonuclease III [Spirochaetaceae bacterium]|nr:endonuclease III [Spirochaetaceae bacterium]MDT8296812.1 endonuclease III [Spirochaetaceae bacterium]
MRDWDGELGAIAALMESIPFPSVNQIESEHSHPWDVLISTIISLRTRDEVTLAASRRLLDRAPDPQCLLELGRDTVAKLIYPAGFYSVKADQMVRLAGILIENHAGGVPCVLDELLALPGVGLKTANLVLGVGFGIPAICVDIHVHRIANRRGWIATEKPDASEAALRAIVPQKWWIDLNKLLVQFGQLVCTPQSPKCSECPISSNCPRIGVTRQR